MKFNFTRNSKTKKGKLNTVRSVTKDHEAYKVYLLAKKLQNEAGNFNSIVKMEYVLQAEKLLKEKKDNELL